MTKWDIYATIAIQVEAETQGEAVAEAYMTPIEYWQNEDLDIYEAVGRAD